MNPTRRRALKLLAYCAAVLFAFGSTAALADDKTSVTISGILVANKVYDGASAVTDGTPTVADGSGNPVDIDSGDLVYTYTSTDDAGYQSNSAPVNAGDYQLVVSVSGSNADYEGESAAISFTIDQAPLTIIPDGGITRYAGLSNPSFPYAYSGVVSGETPAFTGALSGAGTDASTEGVYDISIGSLTPGNNGAFLAANYSTSFASGASYRVEGYTTDAVATVADTNMSTSGIYTGDVTLVAPTGYTIALSPDATAWGSTAVKTDCTNGENVIYYYLRVSGGENGGAMTGAKVISIQYDANKPVVRLYSPADGAENAAATDRQKIILSANEPIEAVSGKNVTVTDGTTTYAAAAESGTLIGNAEYGPWYLCFDLTDFSDGAHLLTLAGNTSYNVTIDEGAYTDLAGNACAEGLASFTTIDAGDLSAPVSVVYTLISASQTVQTEAGDPVVSGQAIENNTTLQFESASSDGYTVSRTVKLDGTEITGADLSSYALTGDLEVYESRTRTAGGLSATVQVVGTAQYGGTLSGSVTDLNDTNTDNLIFTWVRQDAGVDTVVARGDMSTTYTLKAADVGMVIRLDVTDKVYTGTLSDESAVIAKAPYVGSIIAPPDIEARTETGVTLVARDGYQYSCGGTSWQDSNVFSGLTSGQTYNFYQRVKETDTVLASDSSAQTAAIPAPVLTGTVSISGTAQSGKTLTGSISETNNTGTLTYTWKRGDTSVGTGTQYTPTSADVGNVLTLEVTSSIQTGARSTTTAAVAKADYSGPVVAPPSVETLTATSVTLTASDGYQYSCGGTSWQDSNVFSGLTSGQTYNFYQRVKETDTVLASASSARTAVTTISALTGTVSISGTAQSGKTLTGSISETNNTGALTYTWKRGDTSIGTGTQYTPTSADVGNVLTLEVTSSVQTGARSTTTAAIGKAVNSLGAPDAPALASATATTITLVATDGYQYSLGGTSWQDTTTFHNLSAGQSYMFYQRVKETDTELCSAASPGAAYSTLAGLSGTVMVSGEARYGQTMVASLTNTNNTGTLTYTWRRGTITVGTGTTYVVSAIDIGNQLSVEVTSTDQGGSITRSFGTVAKAYYFGDTPDAPTRYSRTTTKIVLNSVSGCEYSKDGTNWQDSTTFSGLSSGKTYSFYQRYKATTTMEASSASAALKTATSSSSSSSSSSSTPTPTPDDSSDTETKLYSYTLTSDNTRILYSVMKNLAAGNKTSDVVIKQSNVEITFLKGTMTDSYTQLWYDFGTSINNSIVEQTAKQIAGDAYVATIHFNYEGELPGTASIRFWLGATNAGKTLYYYKLNDDNTLTFMQTAVADSTGWVTVTQTSCSNYVFLSQEAGSVSTTPTPTPAGSASVSPTPTPLVDADESSSSLSADGWLVAAIILLAVALIVGGIWLYTKSRDDY